LGAYQSVQNPATLLGGFWIIRPPREPKPLRPLVNEPARSEVLRQPIYVSAETETHSYDLIMPCSEVFRDPVPSF
jgi:hypothetical protein